LFGCVGFEGDSLGLEGAVGSFVDLVFEAGLVGGDEDEAEVFAVLDAGEAVEQVVSVVQEQEVELVQDHDVASVLDLVLDFSLEFGGVVSCPCFFAGDRALELLEYLVLGVVLVAGNVVAFQASVEFDQGFVCENRFPGSPGSVEEQVGQCPRAELVFDGSPLVLSFI
jgi:hypothetical protein